MSRSGDLIQIKVSYNSSDLHVRKRPGVCHCVRLFVRIGAELSADSKVTDLGQAEARFDKNVVWLQITVNLVLLFMQVSKPLQDVPSKS